MPLIINKHSIDNLYRDNHSWLVTWLTRRLSCSETASDLTQDIFIKILKNKQIEIREPKAFITTVAKRILYDHWRRERLKKAYLEELANTPESFTYSCEEQAIIIETLVEIDKMLDGLPVIVRRAFLLAQLDGMKRNDIANELGISLSTVKRYLRQAAMSCYFATNE